jgi:hypothetical protein
MGRVCHLMNKMYREMLCITTHERMTYIVMGTSGPHEHQVRAFSWPSQYKIVLSWGLLSWILVEGRIPCSFANFITTPELSGHLYIGSDIYHTQITEYLLWALSLCIEHLPHCYSARKSSIPDRSLWEHLSRALPTEIIFYRLRTIPSDRLFSGYSTELILNTLEIIVKWLQVSVSECNRQTPQTKNPLAICLGTWFRATERLVRSVPGWASSIQSWISRSEGHQLRK